MAQSCTSFDSTTKKGSYVISQASEISNLPTTTTTGKDDLENYSTCCTGSECICIATGDVYLLDGDVDEWKTI